MSSDGLEAKFRSIEDARDIRALPGVYLVLRLDGRSFSRLTRDTHPFIKPYDERFRDMMLETTEHLMTCAGHSILGYTQSDEISVLLPPSDNSFGRSARKLLSIYAGEASAKFSLQLGAVASLDCRICELPSVDDVVDYFRWRADDAHRNSLNAHCYWKLRGAGQSAEAATASLAGLSVSEQNELLFRNGVNFNDLPAWQKRGVALCWEWYDKPATNPKTGEPVVAKRRRIARYDQLPIRDVYAIWLKEFIATAENDGSSS